MGHLAGLDQGQRLEQLVQGAETAGHRDESARVLEKHRLAGEEIAEVDAEPDVRIEPLLVGKFDAETHGCATRLAGPLVAGLHDAGPATGDDGEPTLREVPGDPFRGPVHRVGGCGSRGTEDADCGGQSVEGVESLHELGLDAKHPPRILAGPFVPVGAEQRLVGGRHLLAGLAAEHHGSLAAFGHRFLLQASQRRRPSAQVLRCSAGQRSSSRWASDESPGP